MVDVILEVSKERPEAEVSRTRAEDVMYVTDLIRYSLVGRSDWKFPDTRCLSPIWTNIWMKRLKF